MAGVADCMNGSGIRSLSALYVAAPFSMGYVDFYTFLMPLYALSLGFDAAEVGADSLGHIAENRHIRSSLHDAVARQPGLTLLAPDR